MELREYLYILRKHWVLIVLTTILGIAASAGASFLMTPQYESKTQLYVSVRGNASTTSDLVQGANFSRQIVNSYVDVITTGVVLDPVVENLDLDVTGTQLAAAITASSPTESALINITATDSDPEQAASIANAVGESFKEVVRTQLEPETEAGASPVSLTTTQVALAPSSPVSPNLLMNLALGFLLGFAVGVGIAILRTTLDTRIHSARDVEQITDKPILGGIVDEEDADQNPLVVEKRKHSPRAEAFRALRTNLQFFSFDSTKRVFVVTSPSPSEGKSTTSVNLALSLAQTESRVLLIEGDLRRPKATEYLGIESGAGLTDVLIGRAELNDVIQRWGRTQLFVLPSGPLPPNPSELLGSTEMKKILEETENTFDYIIIDAPPVLAVTDATVVTKLSSGALMVAAAGSTTKQALDSAINALETADARILGVVLTRLPQKGPDSYGYQTYGYTAETTSVAELKARDGDNE